MSKAAAGRGNEKLQGVGRSVRRCVAGRGLLGLWAWVLVEVVVIGSTGGEGLKP